MTDRQDWAVGYRELAVAVADAAPGAGPHLMGFNACVDAIWRVPSSSAAS